MGLGKFVYELNDMPASEYEDWRQYFNENPWGPERDNWHSATIAALLWNINSGKDSPRKYAKDFMYIESGIKKQTETLNTLEIMRAMGKRGNGKRTR